MYETSYNIQPHIHIAKDSSVKMKSFIETDSSAIEEKVNEWLNQNNVSINHIGQSQCERNGRLLFVLNIFYSQQ
jgi:hypothetical protein